MPNPDQSDAEFQPSDAYSNYVLGLLFLVYVFNFVDRQILSVFLGPIQEDLGVSDTVMGFLTGFAFALFYTVAGIPIARWADTGSRRFIIATGLAVWSLLTAATGMVRNVTELTLARIGVGVGEAAGTPPAHALISDYFPPERRATALSIYSMGIYIGSAIAFIFGGVMRSMFDWRVAFIVVGLPGLILALLVRFTIREPPRGLAESGPVADDTPTMKEVASYLSQRRSFLYLVAAVSCQSLPGYGFLVWGYTFLSRVHEMDYAAIGLWLGLIVGIGGMAGTLIGGWTADRLGRRDKRWYIWIPAIVSFVGIPFAVPFLFLENPTYALLSFAVFYTLSAMYLGPVLSMVQGMAKVRMRAVSSSVLLFVVNLVGLGLGSQMVGIFNDLFHARYGVEGIRYSLLILAAVGWLSAPLFLLAARHLRADLEASRS
jgi:MFS family permease